LVLRCVCCLVFDFPVTPQTASVGATRGFAGTFDQLRNGRGLARGVALLPPPLQASSSSGRSRTPPSGARSSAPLLVESSPEAVDRWHGETTGSHSPSGGRAGRGGGFQRPACRHSAGAGVRRARGYCRSTYCRRLSAYDGTLGATPLFQSSLQPSLGTSVLGWASVLDGGRAGGGLRRVI
jgi:hypothetical protein